MSDCAATTAGVGIVKPSPAPSGIRRTSWSGGEKKKKRPKKRAEYLSPM